MDRSPHYSDFNLGLPVRNHRSPTDYRKVNAAGAKVDGIWTRFGRFWALEPGLWTAKRAPKRPPLDSGRAAARLVGLCWLFCSIPPPFPALPTGHPTCIPPVSG